ncbi:MAG: hypothetical protein H0W78_05840 [Planctomycetes bacterium]|jgi:hypothetical protein|nr:hypothetical protein [Planctomycetota bacterium]
MGSRFWLCAIVLLTALVIVACSSPGQPFAYLDVKVSGGPTATPSQPVIGQATTIRFTVRNTWNQPLTGVVWELRETSAPASTLTSGTTDLIAFGSSVHEFVIASPTAGTHTYEVVVDPGNLVVEQDETNNTSGTLTVLVADQDIAFDTVTAPAVTWPAMGMGMGSPHVDDAHTLTFTITNTLNPAQLSPAATISVPFTITRNDVAVAYTATPTSPATVAAQSGVTPGSTAVSVNLPATGSAGAFVYTITLSPAEGDDNRTNNNSFSVTVVIPASS